MNPQFLILLLYSCGDGLVPMPVVMAPEQVVVTIVFDMRQTHADIWPSGLFNEPDPDKKLKTDR
jgi:hypothetical protein